MDLQSGDTLGTMKERPILFSGPMVRAILAGAKTQTRPVVLPQPSALFDLFGQGGLDVNHKGQPCYSWVHRDTGEWHSVRCPYGVPGDRLWVRETWRLPLCLDHLSSRAVSEQAVAAGYNRPWAPIRYEADAERGMEADDPAVFGAPGAVFGTEWGRLRRSIHMPRWASRLTLEVTDVRVERVQEIGAGDALAEGVGETSFWQPDSLPHDFEAKWWDDHHFWTHYPQMAFKGLWDSINEARGYGWDANPFVWAVSFKVLTAARGETQP